MKKIFTLLTATLFTVAIFAADHRPVVTVKASKNYEIVIDGRSYFSSNRTMNLSNIRKGHHSIKVYEVSRNYRFRQGKRLVDASAFQLRNKDVEISINYRGQISITEDRLGRDKWNDQRDNDRDNDYGRDQKDRHDQDSRDKDHGNDKNDRDKRF